MRFESYLFQDFPLVVQAFVATVGFPILTAILDEVPSMEIVQVAEWTTGGILFDSFCQFFILDKVRQEARILWKN